MLAVCRRPGSGLGSVQPLIIERRFNGPPDSGNGGYVCGLLATAVDREAGRREVWYRLTPAGQDLGPALDERDFAGQRPEPVIAHDARDAGRLQHVAQVRDLEDRFGAVNFSHGDASPAGPLPAVLAYAMRGARGPLRRDARQPARSPAVRVYRRPR